MRSPPKTCDLRRAVPFNVIGGRQNLPLTDNALWWLHALLNYCKYFYRIALVSYEKTVSVFNSVVLKCNYSYYLVMLNYTHRYCNSESY